MKKLLFLVCVVLAISGCGGDNVDELPCLTCDQRDFFSSSSYNNSGSSSSRVFDGKASSSSTHHPLSSVTVDGSVEIENLDYNIRGLFDNYIDITGRVFTSHQDSLLSNVVVVLNNKIIKNTNETYYYSYTIEETYQFDEDECCKSACQLYVEASMSGKVKARTNLSIKRDENKCVIPSSSSVAPSSSSSVSSSSSSIGYAGSYGSLYYEGQTYKTVIIGTQTWMAENLNYDASSSSDKAGYCLVNEICLEGPFSFNECYAVGGLPINKCSVNSVSYGQLYDWSTAMAFPSSCNSSYCSSQIQSKHRGICPSGWHIPSNADWDKLFRYVDGTSGTESPYDSPTAGRYLKATSGWDSYNGVSGNGTDQYGFSALPSYDQGDFGLWLSASEADNSHAYSRVMWYGGGSADWDDGTRWGDNFNKSSWQSVRCLQD